MLMDKKVTKKKKEKPDADEKMVLKHLAKDTKEFKAQLKDDAKLKKKLLKK